MISNNFFHSSEFKNPPKIKTTSTDSPQTVFASISTANTIESSGPTKISTLAISTVVASGKEMQLVMN